jgi:hypothetical protein
MKRGIELALVQKALDAAAEKVRREGPDDGRFTSRASTKRLGLKIPPLAMPVGFKAWFDLEHPPTGWKVIDRDGDLILCEKC